MKAPFKILSLILCLCMIISVFPAVPAADGNDRIYTQSDVDEAKKKLDEIRSERIDTQKALAEIEHNENYTKAAVAFAEKLIDGYIEEIKNINTIISDYDHLIGQAELEAAETQKEYEETYDIYLSRLRSSREDGDYTALEILLNSKSFLEFISSAERVLDALDYDGRIMDKLADKKAELSAKLKTLETYLAEQKKQVDDYENQKLAIEERITALTEYLKSLDETNTKESEYKAFLEKQEADAEQELINTIREYAEQKKSEASYAVGERMKWPLAESWKYISSQFGYRTDPVTGEKMAYHAGIDIPASNGENVYACLSGVVVTAAYMSNGYGYYIIIDHGIFGLTNNHLYSIYAHNSKLLVEKGQKVKQGDMISRSGSTGKSTGPHLHFELRLGTDTYSATAVNPLDYVKKPD